MTPSPEFLAQHAALTQVAGLAMLDRTLLAVTGADRATFLHGFTTNDVKRLTAGSGCEAFVTSPQGKTLGHVFLFCEADRFVLDTVAGQADALSSHFGHYIITEEVEFKDQSAERCDILVAGARAHDILQKVSGAAMPVERLGHLRATIMDRDVVIRRVDYAGPSSFFVCVARANAEAVIRPLLDEGAVVCNETAVEAARIEAGFPLFGRDISPDNLPQEIGRDRQAISFTKGCYLGQETVARIDAVGHVNRLLVGLCFSGGEMPASGTPVLDGGQQVGLLTSATWSPLRKAPLALAYVRRSHARPGSVLSSSAGDAVVVTLPASV
jgi:folate-binding protein YgfZ